MLVGYFGFKRIIHPKCLLVYYLGFNRIHSSQVGSAVRFGFKRIYSSKVSYFASKRTQCVLVYSSISSRHLLDPKGGKCVAVSSVGLFPQDLRLPWSWADRCSTLANWSHCCSPLVPVNTRDGHMVRLLCYHYSLHGTRSRALQITWNALDSIIQPIDDLELGPW